MRCDRARGLKPGSDEHVGDGAGGVRRGRLGWVGVGDLRREPEVGEDLADDVGVLDGRDQAQAAATPRAGQDVEVEGMPHEVGPGPVAGFLRHGDG